MPGHYVCVPVVHTPTQQAYSVIHLAIQLSYLLVLLGLFLYLHHQCETFTQNNLDTVRITFQFTGANAVPAHYFEFFDDFQKSCIFICLFVFGFVWVFCFLICFSPRQHMYMTLCTNQTHAFHLSPKVWSTTFSKSFQYLKITLLLHGSLHSCSRSASCLTSLTAYEGKCYIILGLYSRVQSLVCKLVRFW